MTIVRRTADRFTVRVPSGVYISSLSQLTRAVGTSGVLKGYVSSLRTRSAYATFARSA